MSSRRGSTALCLLQLLFLPSVRAAAKQPGKKRPLAAVVVNSKKWRLLRMPGEVEEFSGDVHYRQGDRQVSADWARLDRATGLWQARGGVRASLRRGDGSVLEVRGERAEHGEASRRGWVSGATDKDRIEFEYYAAPPPDEAPIPHAGPILPAGPLRERGSARLLEWDDENSTMRLRGDVQAAGEDGTTRSDEAEYRSEGERIVLTGRRPVVTRDDAKWTGAVQADRITAARERGAPSDASPETSAGPGRVDADGRVKGWLRFKRTPALPRS